MGVFNVGLFSKPRYSAFPWNHNNKFSTKTGVIKPVATEFLDTGEVFDLNDISAVCRQAPMLAPTLDTHYMDIHAFALRLRSLGNASRNPWVYEDFFNLNKNTAGSLRLPSFPLGCMFAANGFKTGTLYESLGFPIFTDFREKYLEFIRNKCPWVFDPVTSLGLVKAASSSGDSPSVYLPDDYSFGVGVIPSSLGSNLFRGVEWEDSLEQVHYADIYNLLPFLVSVVNEDAQFNFTFNGHSFYEHSTGQTIEVDAVPVDTCFSYRGNLVNYIITKYPDAFPEFFDFYNFYSNSSSAINDITSLIGSFVFSSFVSSVQVSPGGSTLALPFGGDLSAWVDVYNKKLSGINLLDRVYEVYKVDSATVLKDFEDWLLQGALNLSQSGTQNSDYSDIYYYLEDDTAYGFYLDSVFEILRTKLINGFPLSLQDNDFATYTTSGGEVGISEVMLPSYFIEGYWKILSDWYINTAIQNPDTFMQQHIINDVALVDDDNLGWPQGCCQWFGQVNDLYRRFWKNDYFTSAFPSPQAGQAVGIPVNGTIVDLRNANAMQKLRERLLYAGQRFRDVLYAITGKKTSSAILEMSEVIGSWSLTINVDSVLQQSQSNENNPLASYGGTGLGYRSSGRGCKYVAEEPTIIIFLCSIRPQASYFQGLPRKFTRMNVYDYDIPQLANVGEQDVRLNELYVGSDSTSTPNPNFIIFGYQRRNGDFMWTPNEVHGEFQTSLDFWHNARKFSSRPSLGVNFLQVNPVEDNLNRIFAVPSDSVDRWYCRIDFEGQVIRHLPKHVHYDL